MAGELQTFAGGVQRVDKYRRAFPHYGCKFWQTTEKGFSLIARQCSYKNAA